MTEFRRPEIGIDLSLADIIRQRATEKRAGIRIGDVARELARLSRASDSEGMVDLFGVILDWELRACATRETPNATRRRTLENFDFAAGIADEILEGNAPADYDSLPVPNDNNLLGEAKIFCRTSIGYSSADYRD